MQRRQHDNEQRWRLANLLMLVEELISVQSARVPSVADGARF